MKCCFVVAFFGCLISCSNSKKSAGDNERGYQQQELHLEKQKGKSSIAFLTLGVWLQDSLKHEYRFNQQSVIYAEGQLKAEKSLYNHYEPYQLYWEMRNVKNELVAQGNVPDPLLRAYETSDPETGKLFKHLVITKQGEIVLRFNLTNEAELLSIYRWNNAKLNKIYEARLL